MSTSGAGANCILYDVVDPKSNVFVKLVSDHAGFEGSAAFFKESINRPIITGRNLWVNWLSEYLQREFLGRDHHAHVVPTINRRMRGNQWLSVGKR